ncbi:CurL C-terminal domain-containing protein [Streptomyces sp. NPDC002755]|uniref:CurL C-terminal domain-containing protein n=1 Tax=Streptomyces sp. NPDC002884 TaxID=3154544 RepID=UPI00331A6D58
MTLTDLPRVLAVSARDPESLAETRGRLAGWLENTPDADLDDVALTLSTGRERFPCRYAVTGDAAAEAAALLADVGAPTDPAPVRAPGDGPLLLLDGTALTPASVDLPEVADALRVAGEHADAEAARTVAVLYGLAAWLRARGVTPCAVRGTGAGALAAAAVRGDLALPDALSAAAAGVPGTDEDLPEEHTGAPVVVIGAPRPETPDALTLDPADGTSYARLLAELWRRGYAVDTSLGRPGRRVRLPGHPFRRREPGGPAPAGTAPTRPLTPYEQRWLFYDLVRHGSSGDHNAAVATVVPGPPPAPDALGAAFAELQRRHPALRTVFSEPGGRWQARILPTPDARPAPLVPDPDGGPEHLREAVLDAARQPLPLRDTPLVRCCSRGGPARWALALAVYEPLTATLDPRRLLDELVGLLGADAPPAPPRLA